MKKQNLSSLTLKKSKISNLNRLINLRGGTDTTFPVHTEEEGCASQHTQCGEECASLNPTDCQTNDTIRSLGNPTEFGTGVIRTMAIGCQ
ncbi:hypothetical protein [Kordia sp.]|uniref:hypothetical protein n=1 Tax=Kordia sp. TaxID=1965332 RepID=UPI003B592BEF